MSDLPEAARLLAEWMALEIEAGRRPRPSGMALDYDHDRGTWCAKLWFTGEEHELRFAGGVEATATAAARAAIGDAEGED